MRWGRWGERARIDLVLRAAEAGRHAALVSCAETGIDTTRGGRGTAADLCAARP